MKPESNKYTKELATITKLVDKINSSTPESEKAAKLCAELEKLAAKTTNAIQARVRGNVLVDLGFEDCANVFFNKASELGYVVESSVPANAADCGPFFTMEKKALNKLKILNDIKPGTYSKNSAEYDALKYYRDNDAYKLTSHDKKISFNTNTDAFIVEALGDRDSGWNTGTKLVGPYVVAIINGPSRKDNKTSELIDTIDGFKTKEEAEAWSERLNTCQGLPMTIDEWYAEFGDDSEFTNETVNFSLKTHNDAAKKLATVILAQSPFLQLEETISILKTLTLELDGSEGYSAMNKYIKTTMESKVNESNIGFDLVYEITSKMNQGDGVSGTIRTTPNNYYYVATVNSDKSLSFEGIEAMTKDINQDEVNKLWLSGTIPIKNNYSTNEGMKQVFLYDPKDWNKPFYADQEPAEKPEYNKVALQAMISDDTFLKFSYHSIFTGDDTADFDKMFNSYVKGDNEMLAKMKMYESHTEDVLSKQINNNYTAKSISTFCKANNIAVTNEAIYNLTLAIYEADKAIKEDLKLSSDGLKKEVVDIFTQPLEDVLELFKDKEFKDVKMNESIKQIITKSMKKAKNELRNLDNVLSYVFVTEMMKKAIF